MSPTATARFGRVVTAMVTPFDRAGALDVDAAVTLARSLAANGSSGLVVTGTTGESPTLSDEEKLALYEAVSAAVTIPVLAGAATNDTAHSVALVARAATTGVAGILAVVPYYSRPSQAGIAAHFRALAEASDLPILCYDVPARTGRRIERTTLLELARSVPSIVGVKDASGDLPGAARLIAEAPPGFACYCGDDALTLAFAAIGAVGVVSVAAHWAGVEIDELLSCVLAGDLDGARRADARLAGSYDFITSDEAPNPLPTKAMCAVLGFDVGGCRLPLGPIPEVLKERATAVLADLERSRAGI